MNLTSRKSMLLILVVLLSLAAAGCTNMKKTAAAEPTLPPQEMVDDILKQVEQPSLIDIQADAVKDMYDIDPALLETYVIKMPMMNIKTNELAILQVKEEKDLPTVEAGVKKRAEAVQKQFETYLPDQYENAKNYKLVTKGNYVLFVISEDADKIVSLFEGYFPAGK
ncbi:DUF4358 domain-containing protein [Gorillibacterium timonense]|uniref:DUF4358 domain-containing protein n=1 Tax=Gorillibacterium timonense TaxID=1689269 RepID=UPI00071CF793|nr:DUF4358 domain-containing protein [Gorillibacterium timonense]